MLETLRKSIEGREARIAVVGLGYVGLPVACMFAQAGFHTIGVDLDAERVAKVNNGINPIEGDEPHLAELIANVIPTRRLQCTTDYANLHDTDVILIAVQTPVDDSDHLPRYAHLRSALQALGAIIKQGALIIVESTLAPRTMYDVVIPTLEEASHSKVGEGFFVGHCPERVMPGRLLLNIRTMSRVVGGYDEDVADTMRRLYENIVEGELDTTDLLTAEIVKTAENAYRDVQIAFANEVAQVCEVLGGDVWKVRELVNKSPGRNMLLPGAGVGGHCIPKDPWLLIANARHSYQAQVIPAARQVNRAMPAHVAEILRVALQKHGVNLAQSNIAVLGYAYMENSDDTRDTPSQTFIDLLEGQVQSLKIHDPFVPDYRGELTNIIKNTDAIVILVKHAPYFELDWHQIISWMRTPVIIDARRVLPDDLHIQGATITLLGRANNIKE